MGYETNIENAIRTWLTANSDVIKEAITDGAARAVADRAPDAVMRLGTGVAVILEKWLESNKTAMIDAIAGQIATFNQQRYGCGDISIRQTAARNGESPAEIRIAESA